MEIKSLGKITNIYIGLGGRDDNTLGLYLTIDTQIGGTATHNMFIINDKYDNSKDWHDYIHKLLNDCKVYKIEQIKGKPVEAIWENNYLKSWRILTEVL